MNRKRFALFSRPSFLQGMGRLLDFGKLYDSYNHSRNGQEADHRAIRSDWDAVGNDLWQAIVTVKTGSSKSR